MSGIIFKYFRTIMLLTVWVFTYNVSLAKDTEVNRHLKLIIGAGYGHFFNNFTNVSDNDVITNKPAFEGKLLWQPEHRLRIGLESGYYFMYSTTRIQTDGSTEKLTTSLNVVPLFMSFSMRVIDRFELQFATGWASMIYVIKVNKSNKNKVVGHTFSMSNVSLGCSYYWPLGKKFDIGAEMKYLYLGKTDDQYASLSINLAWKFVTWKGK